MRTPTAQNAVGRFYFRAFSRISAPVSRPLLLRRSWHNIASFTPRKDKRMTPQTRAILTPLLDNDRSVSADERAAVFDILEGRSTGARQTLDRVMSREEVAKMLNCSTKTVSRYAERGIIRAICLGEKGRRASNGYSAKSVEEALQRATAESKVA